MKTWFAPLGLCLFLVLGTGAACRDGGGGGGDPDAGTEDGGGSDGGTVEGWRWKACPLHTDDIWGKQAECAMIPVPLDWADPEGPSIEIFVKRLKTEGTSKGQLWLLQGGPGGSGAAYEYFQDQFADLDGNWDTYAIDHRGVGKSARLGCPQEAATANKPFGLAPEDFEACLASLQAEWGEDLAHFNTTNAAKDLEHLIAETRSPGEQVFVYGASYGTTWAHRYLQLDPAPIDGVILDSLAINIFFTDFDAYFNQVGEDFLALCTADADCNTKVGGDAWGAVGLALDAIEAGSCSELGLDRKQARWFFADLLMNVATRDLIPAVAHRIQRCEAGDVAAIEQLRGVMAGFMPDYLRELDSRSLGLNIIASEFWPDPAPTLAELQAIVDQAYFCPDAGPTYGAMREFWPLYPTDAHHLQWAATDLPVLILQGDLDPQTPHWVAEPARPHFSGASQWFVTVPNSPHGVLMQTPTTNSNVPCGTQIFQSFLNDPTVAPNTWCTSRLLPINFNGHPGYAQYFLGTDDFWENTKTRSEEPAPAPPGVEESLRFSRSLAPLR